MILVDSCVWIEALRGRATPETDRLRAYAGDNRVVIADLVLAEVLRGIADERLFHRTRDRLLRYPLVVVGGAEVAARSADAFRRLRALGISVRSTIDCLIAARCLADDHALLTADRDFAPFATHFGLKLG